MRYILRFCAVLTVASLSGTAATAYGYQGRTGGGAPPPPPAATGTQGTVSAAGTTVTVPNAPQGQATGAAAAASPVDGTVPTGTVPTPGANPTGTATGFQAPGASGTVNLNTTNPATAVTSPVQSYQSTGQPAGVTNPAPGSLANPLAGTSANYGGTYAPATQPGTATLVPGAPVPGSVNTDAAASRTYSSYYVPGVETARTPVTPMANIPYYSSYYSANAGQPGMANSGYYSYPGGGYGLSPYPSNAYSSMYVTPGYGTTAPNSGTYYGSGTTSPYYGAYSAPQRRGFLGGMFRRRGTYATTPYGYTTTTTPYGYTTTAPYGYTYGVRPRGY